MNAILVGIVISMLPFVELRLAIPFVIALGVSPFVAFFWCVLANILVIPLIFLFYDRLHGAFLGFGLYSRIFDKYLERTRGRVDRIERKVNRYGLPALAAFTAVPLPVTGAYTSSFVSWVLGLERWKAFVAIACGVFVAGVLVTLASVGVLEIFRMF